MSENKNMAYWGALAVRAIRDPAALTELYEYYFPRVYQYLLGKTKDSSLADELVSDTFVRMYQHLEQFDPDKVDIRFASAAGEIDVCLHGRGLAFDEDLAKRILTEHDVVIRISMGEGKASCVCWGCDITYEYIKINGDYRT